MGLNELRDKIHSNAVAKGFWESDNIPQHVMLVVTELSEAIDADRSNKYTILNDDGKRMVSNADTWEEFMIKFDDNVKDTFEDEIADTIIRLLDICGHKNIDIKWHIQQKMKYNSRRSYKHGKKY